jgi:hypothetical protein
VKPADPDFGIADLVDDALARFYESGVGVRQLLRDLMAARHICRSTDGKLPADLLDPRPHQVPDLLLEAEDCSPDARAFAMPRTSGHCGRPGRSLYAVIRWIWPDFGECSTVRSC